MKKISEAQETFCQQVKHLAEAPVNLASKLQVKLAGVEAVMWFIFCSPLLTCLFPYCRNLNKSMENPFWLPWRSCFLNTCVSWKKHCLHCRHSRFCGKTSKGRVRGSSIKDWSSCLSSCPQLQDVLSWMQPGVSITTTFALSQYVVDMGWPLAGTRTIWEN